VPGPTPTAEAQRAKLAALVEAARNGERAAWDELVDRLAKLVWSITRAYGLESHDGDDVAQIAWMRLAEHIDRLQDPGAVKTWLATTTRRECITLLRQRARVEHVDVDLLTDALSVQPADEPVLTRDRDRAVWAAFRELPDRCRRLLYLVVADREAGYEAISAALDMPIGSIGPTRQRCLERLRSLIAGAGITSLSDASL
jgi:RNA polymerase sigma factor (sigma-70 family)